ALARNARIWFGFAESGSRVKALGAQFVQRRFGVRRGEAHGGEDVIRFRELDLVVLDDLDEVAGRVVEVEAPPGWELDAGFLERAAGGVLVVDDEAEMRFLSARAAFEERDELVAEFEERGVLLAALDGGRLEERRVELDRRLEVVDLQRDVVDPGEARLHSRRTITRPPSDSPAAAKPLRS